MGIEPTLSAWEAKVLPLNYTRKIVIICYSWRYEKFLLLFRAIFKWQ